MSTLQTLDITTPGYLKGDARDRQQLADCRLPDESGVAVVLFSHVEVRSLAVLKVGALVVSAVLCNLTGLNRIWRVGFDDFHDDPVARLQVVRLKPHKVLVLNTETA
jgi:hypothetical protein